MNQKLKECNVQSDCGVTGINGWTRCVGGSDDGKKYCVWPGQTYTPNPRELKGQIPKNMKREPLPMTPTVSSVQSNLLDVQAQQANSINSQMPGGSLRNVSGPPAPVGSLYSK